MRRLSLFTLMLGALPGLGVAQMLPIFGPKQYTRTR